MAKIVKCCRCKKEITTQDGYAWTRPIPLVQSITNGKEQIKLSNLRFYLCKDCNDKVIDFMNKGENK